MYIKLPDIIKLLLGILSPLVLCFLISVDTHATYIGSNGRILYRTSDSNIHLSSIDGSDDITLENIGYQPFFNPNGNGIISPNAYSLSFADLSGQNLNYVSLPGGNIQLMSDGVRVSYLKDGKSYVANLDGSHEQVVSYLNNLVYSPDGKKGASVTGGYSYPSIYIYTNSDLPVGDPTKGGYSAYYEDSNEFSIGCSSWSPDSNKIAFTYIAGLDTSWRNESMKVLDITTKAVTTYHVAAPFLGCPVWSPDQTKIIYSANYGNYYNPTPESYKLDILDLTTGVDTTLKNTYAQPLDWQSVSDAIPVYRFWSKKKNHHFYTSNYNETVSVLQNYDDETWSYEAPAFKVHGLSSDNCKVGESPVYRFWSDKYQGHFYTINATERDQIVSRWPSTWRYEGAVFCAATSAIGDLASPVYRFWSDTYQGHFYTTSVAEKDHIIQTWPNIWKYEGVAYYVSN